MLFRSVTETADALYLSARGEGLVAPRVTVSTEEGILLERPMERAAPGFWTVGLALAPGRAYSVALGDQGALAAKLPVYRNGGLGARTDASMAAERDYRVPPFALLGRGEPWLFLFFALSLCASVYLRWTR